MSIEATESSSAEAIYAYSEIPTEENLFEQTVPLEEFTGSSDNLAKLQAEESLIRGQQAQTPVLRNLSPTQQQTLDAILSKPPSSGRDNELEEFIDKLSDNFRKPDTNSDLLLQDLKFLLQYFKNEEKQSMNGWLIYSIQICLKPEHVEKTVEEALSWVSRSQDSSFKLTEVTILAEILISCEDYGIFSTPESKNSLVKADEIIQEFADSVLRS